MENNGKERIAIRLFRALFALGGAVALLAAVCYGVDEKGILVLAAVEKGREPEIVFSPTSAEIYLAGLDETVPPSARILILKSGAVRFTGRRTNLRLDGEIPAFRLRDGRIKVGKCVLQPMEAVEIGRYAIINLGIWDHEKVSGL